jgi:alkaline phosphatase D
MPVSRRDFLKASAAQTALAGLGVSACSRPLGSAGVRAGENAFGHGVASGDPLSDRVILWTRVSPREDRLEWPVHTDWWIALDAEGEQAVGRGQVDAHSDTDFTIKIDADGLAPGTDYYYGFEAGGVRSPTGRTRTLPDDSVERVRIAFTSCANYPQGFFNVYSAIAARDDVDVVLHLGDYIYEYANGGYGDGTALGRIPDPDRVTVRLEDYRRRHAQYKSDPDLQAAHARHPWITVWDDHEIADNAHREGSLDHEASLGDWQTRKLSAIRAYYEWMPIRELPTRLFRTFRFGTLLDLVMLDTRLHGRDRQVAADDHESARDPARSILGEDQTGWLLDFLSGSKEREATWRVVGQQVIFSPFNDGMSRFNPDSWDGYRENRTKVLDHLAHHSIDNVIFLTGDVHSSWAFEVPPTRVSGIAYDAESGSGSQAVEFVTPAVTSSTPGSSPNAGKHFEGIVERIPHLKYANVYDHGFVVLDMTKDRARAEYVFVDSTATRSVALHAGPILETVSGTSHLLRVDV